MKLSNQLDAPTWRLFTVKNANSYSDAIEAFKAWQEAHLTPVYTPLEPWMKDFVNWLLAKNEVYG